MKDQTRNIETFKVGKSHLNKFDFHKHQGEMHEHGNEAGDQLPDKVETTAERVARLTKQAHQKVQRKKKRR
jgi:hypothetical protein